ncbi:MAG: hypothetical protein JAY90_23580 [Candidatus Thiodiazotropha lotti]|nr:hypothetical protein [Candidatus Thiodiazotropha lotti]
MTNPKANPHRKVVIYDDETDRATEWKKMLEEMGALNINIRVPNHNEIQTELDELYHRRRSADLEEDIFETESALDDTDILIVDYDLRHLEGHRDFATGEEIAYSARLFSKVKLIIVVNHPDIGLNNFDLTFQRDANLKGDFYIGEHQIDNPTLWTQSDDFDGYHPWGWPILTEEIDLFDSCLQSIKEHLDEPFLTYFGFDRENCLPSSEMMSYLGISNTATTFKQIIEHGKPTPYARPKDKVALQNDDERLCRVLTAVLRKWLRSWVLTPQSVLADAPHIALSMPWSLNDYTNPDCWYTLPFKSTSMATEVLNSFHDVVVQNRFERNEWIGRPVFFKEAARISLEEQSGLLDSFEFSKLPDLQFAEDLSRFVLTEDSIEYDITIAGEAQVRAVSDAATIQINNQSFHPNEVIYVPQSLMV